MKITYYDSPTTNYPEGYSASYIIQPYIVLFDLMQFSVDNDWARVLLEDMDTWSQDKCVEVFRDCFSMHETSMAMVELYNKIAPFIKKTAAKKQKDKETLVALGTITSLNRKFKDDLKGYANFLIEGNNLKGVLPFQEEGVFIMKSFDYQQKNNQEYVLISEFTQVIANRDYLISLDESVEEMFSPSNYDETGNNAHDFIKIPLWNVPLLGDLNYKQLKYTRNDLQPAMAPFKIKLQEFWDEIVTMQYNDENIEQLKHLCQSQLHPFVKPIQQNIDESLYISQIRNKTRDNKGLKLCIGITSADNIIRYYEKSEIILPYVASEIKQQTSRYLDLNVMQMFVYFKQCM